MKIIAALLFGQMCFAAVAREGSGNGTTTLTFSATATGSLKLIFAYRSGSTTAPSLPAGWTTVQTGATSGGGTTGSFRLGCNVSSSGSDTSSGTWTNATNVVGASYSGTAVNVTADCNTTGIGNLATNNAKTSTTVNFPTITVQSSLNWVHGAHGGSASSVCTPSGMSQYSTTGTVIGNDTNAAVSSWPSTNCTVSSETWMSSVAEIKNPSTLRRLTLLGVGL